MEPNDDMRGERVETAGQLIHAELHRAGTAASCGRCRELAERIARLLEEER